MTTEAEAPSKDAVTVALLSDGIVPVVMLNVAVVELAATVTSDGTLRSGLLEDSVTFEPLEGAALDSVIVQDVLCPKPRLVAEQERE
jgi:hypothetical protein